MQSILPKIKLKKYKRKVNQYIDDDKSEDLHEDLAYNLICYNNLDVVKADEFRKNLGILNNQSEGKEKYQP